VALRTDWWSWLFLTGLTPVGLTTVSRTPLNKWSARRRYFYLTSHNTHKRETSLSPEEFEPTIPTNERLQTHTLDRAATGTGHITTQDTYNRVLCVLVFSLFIGHGKAKCSENFHKSVLFLFFSFFVNISLLRSNFLPLIFLIFQRLILSLYFIILSCSSLLKLFIFSNTAMAPDV
jgi:hypothetical protein